MTSKAFSLAQSLAQSDPPQHLLCVSYSPLLNIFFSQRVSELRAAVTNQPSFMWTAGCRSMSLRKCTVYRGGDLALAAGGGRARRTGKYI